MIDLKNYVPEEPVFKLPKDTPFPRVIFEGAKSMDDIRKLLSGKFICDGVPSGSAVRYLDEYEKRSLRANYSELMEDEQPKYEAELADIEAKMKELVKEAKDKLQSVITQIRDLVYQVKRGEKEVDLPADTTIRMPLNGYFCTMHGLPENSSCAASIKFHRGMNRICSPIWKPTNRPSWMFSAST